MSLLSRVRILTKILAVIALLSIGAAGITVLGVASLKRIAEQTGLVSRTASEALLLARINTNLQALNAGIYRIVSDPRPESRRGAREAIEKEAATFKKRFAALSELVVSEESKARLAQISNEWVALSADLETIYQAAEAVQDFQMTQEMQRVRDAAGSTDKMVDSLRTSLRSMIEIYDERVTTVNSDADAVYVQVSTLMTVVASAIPC